MSVLPLIRAFVSVCLVASWPLLAGVIYSDNFSGPTSPVTLHAMAPTVRPDNEQWAGPNNVFANGTSSTGNSSAWLPVVLQNDQVYTVTLDIDVLYASGNVTDAGIAFTTASPSFSVGTMVNAANFGVLKIRRGGSWLFYATGNDGGITGGANNSLFSSSRSNYEVKLVLTTRSVGPWTLDAFLGGVQQDLAPGDGDSLSYVFPSVPAITGVGLSVSSGTYLMKGFRFEGPVSAEVIQTSSRVVDVFFLAGQSNASGRVYTGYAADARDAKVIYYYQTDGPATNNVTSGGQFITLQPLASGYYGLEISLGRELVSQGYRPAIIKVSDGGTSLAVDWNSISYGTVWKNWLSSTDDAFRKIRAMGCVPRLRGFLWLQGETDATSATNAMNYQTNFNNLVNSVTSRLTTDGYDISNMRFVTALIRSASGTYASTVRDAQQAVMEAHANGDWFDTDDLTAQSDNLHYDAASISTIGLRFASKFPEQTVFAGWAADYDLTGDDALSGSDPDGDGLVNLVEYALGLEPTLTEAPAHTIGSVSAGVMTLSYPVLRSDVTCQPEWSDDLSVWNTDEISLVRDGASVMATMPVAEHSRIFMRLRFSEY